MALEDADYISQLVPTNPPGTDQASTTDDHFRVTKRALQQSFPNINGPVNATPAQLNGLTALGNNLVVLTNSSGIVTTSTYTAASLARIGNALGANSALVSDGSGYIAAHSTVSATELGYLDGVTSSIQTQLNAKPAVAHDHTGGSETPIPTAGIAALAVTAAKIAAGAITDAKISWTLASISVITLATSGGTELVPVGLYVGVKVAGGGVAQLQVQHSASWRTSAYNWSGGVVMSDGTNVRFINPSSGGSASIYLLKLQ